MSESSWSSDEDNGSNAVENVYFQVVYYIFVTSNSIEGFRKKSSYQIIWSLKSDNLFNLVK
jgi:hypothetical protein